MNFLQRLIRTLRAQLTETKNTLSVSSQAERSDVGFVACIESGELERQALMLFESIRRWVGTVPVQEFFTPENVQRILNTK